MTSYDLRNVRRTGRDVLMPVQLRPDAVAPTDRGHARAPVERERRPVGRPRELSRNTSPARAELRQIDAGADGKLVLEIKCVERLSPVHQAQVLNYLRLSGLQAGLLVNFNVAVLQDGLKRVVL